MAGGTTVKQERRDDDREINQMARQIMEQNRQKQGQQPGMVPGQAPASYQMVRPGQPGIQNYFGKWSSAMMRLSCWDMIISAVFWELPT